MNHGAWTLDNLHFKLLYLKRWKRIRLENYLTYACWVRAEWCQKWSFFLLLAVTNWSPWNEGQNMQAFGSVAGIYQLNNSLECTPSANYFNKTNKKRGHSKPNFELPGSKVTCYVSFSVPKLYVCCCFFSHVFTFTVLSLMVSMDPLFSLHSSHRLGYHNYYERNTRLCKRWRRRWCHAKCRELWKMGLREKSSFKRDDQ